MLQVGYCIYIVKCFSTVYIHDILRMLSHVLQLLTTIASDLDAMLIDLGSEDKVKVMTGVKVMANNMAAWTCNNTENAQQPDTTTKTPIWTSNGLNGETSKMCNSQRITETSMTETRVTEHLQSEINNFRTSLVIGDSHKSAFR